MNAREWLAAYAEKLGTEPPTPEEFKKLLDCRRRGGPLVRAGGRAGSVLARGHGRGRPRRGGGVAREVEAAILIIGRWLSRLTTSSCLVRPDLRARLAAEYLAHHAPAETRWALAGRNMSKLEQVRPGAAAPGARSSHCSRPTSTDPGSVRAACGGCPGRDHDGRAVHPLRRAAGGGVRRGGDRLRRSDRGARVRRPDVAGHHEQASRSGARIVHSCGFDSIPYDLGALFTVEQLPEGVPIALEGFVRVGGTFSGGTYQSTIEILGRLRQGASAARERAQAGGRPSEPARAWGIRRAPPRRVRRGWVLPVPDDRSRMTVLRSARALERVRPDFALQPLLWPAKRLPVPVGLAGGAARPVALAQLPPARDALRKLKSSGEGPSPEQAREIVVPGAVPGATRTAGRCTPRSRRRSRLRRDLEDAGRVGPLPRLRRAPERAGQLTPAVAMGDALLAGSGGPDRVRGARWLTPSGPAADIPGPERARRDRDRRQQRPRPRHRAGAGPRRRAGRDRVPERGQGRSGAPRASEEACPTPRSRSRRSTWPI